MLRPDAYSIMCITNKFISMLGISTFILCHKPTTVEPVRDTCSKDTCSTMNLPVEANERRILLIGKAGVGKSSTGNAILGKSSFISKISGSSVTRKIAFDKADRFNRSLLVIDTPGLHESHFTKEEILTEITKCYAISSPGLHAIGLVVEVGRFTEEEKNTLNFFKNVFGKHLSDYLILMFTGKDKLKYEGITIQDYINTLDKEWTLKNLLSEIGNRYVIFGYKEEKEVREREVLYFLDMIEDLFKKNKGQVYTNEMYRKAEEELQKSWQLQLKTEKEKHRKDMQEYISKFRSQFNKNIELQMSEKAVLELEREEYRKQKEREWTENILQKERHYRNLVRRKSEQITGKLNDFPFFKILLEFLDNLKVVFFTY